MSLFERIEFAQKKLAEAWKTTGEQAPTPESITANAIIRTHTREVISVQYGDSVAYVFPNLNSVQGQQVFKHLSRQAERGILQGTYQLFGKLEKKQQSGIEGDLGYLITKAKSPHEWV